MLVHHLINQITDVTFIIPITASLPHALLISFFGISKRLKIELCIISAENDSPLNIDLATMNEVSFGF